MTEQNLPTEPAISSNGMLANRCFGGDCKWRVQGEGCVHCSHPQAIHYHKLKTFCKTCGRFEPMKIWKIVHKVKMWLYNKKIFIKHYPAFACGACIGRGEYVYPFAYDNCDCGGYEARQNNVC